MAQRIKRLAVWIDNHRWDVGIAVDAGSISTYKGVTLTLLHSVSRYGWRETRALEMMRHQVAKGLVTLCIQSLRCNGILANMPARLFTSVRRFESMPPPILTCLRPEQSDHHFISGHVDQSRSRKPDGRLISQKPRSARRWPSFQPDVPASGLQAQLPWVFYSTFSCCSGAYP